MFLRRIGNKKPLSVKSRNNILILVFIVVTALSLINNKQSTNSAFKPQANSQTSDHEKYDGKAFEVVKIVDGDTVDINLRDGKFPTTRIRLLGVDTPETKRISQPEMYFSGEATEFTKTLCLRKQVIVRLGTSKKTRGTYGRLLAYIELEDGEILNSELIINGFGYADTRFAHDFYDEYISLQKDARAKKSGLWKEVTPEQFPHWMQKKALRKN